MMIRGRCNRLSTVTFMTLLVIHWRLMNGVVMVTGRFHRRQERTLSYLSSPSLSSSSSSSALSSSSSSSSANLTPVDAGDESVVPLPIETASSLTTQPVFTFRDCGEYSSSYY
jgi:hypothetical protein